MRKIRLAYGKTGLEVALQSRWDVQVVKPRYTPGLNDPASVLRKALMRPLAGLPLRERAAAGGSVGIIFNDITRATPTRAILSAVLEQLKELPDDQIVLFNALGTHRENTPRELVELIGEEFMARFRVVQNRCDDPSSQICLGTTRRGSPIWINRELAACELKLLTGFIEPHFFAGFSGGGKAVMPGMAGLATILHNHSAARIANPRATWG